MVAPSLEMVEGLADIVHCECDAPGNGVLVLRHPGIYGGMAVVWGKESVAGRHIGRHFAYFRRHMLAVRGVPHIGVVAQPPVIGGPVLLPCRDHIEHIGSRAVGISIGRNPHRGIVVVRLLGHVWLLQPAAFTVAAGNHACAADDGKDGGEHPESFLFHQSAVSSALNSLLIFGRILPMRIIS